jgi:signal transduction histidine kinase
MNSTEKESTSLDYLHPELENLIQNIAQISAKTTTVLDLDELLEKIVDLSQQHLGCHQVALYLCDVKGHPFAIKLVANVQERAKVFPLFTHEVTLAHRAIAESRVILIDNMSVDAHEYYRAGTALKSQSELHVPLDRGNKMIGVFSFYSVRRQAFDRYSVVALKTFVAQITPFIEKAYRYRSMLEAGEVEIDPKDYTHQIEVPAWPEIPTLAEDVQELYNKIVGGVVNELGYSGAMLAVLNEKEKILPVQAIAMSLPIQRVNLLPKVEAILDIKVIGTYASLERDQDNLGVQSCLTGETKISHDLYQLFCPAVSPGRSLWIQRLSGIKTCVSIPLRVEKKVLGNLYVGTTKSWISSEDIKALQLFVTNAAIAVRNAMLFDDVSQKLKQRENQLEQLAEVERMIISSSLKEDLNIVLEKILNGALRLTKAEYGHVVLTDQYASYLTKRVSYPPNSWASSSMDSPGITQWVMQNKKTKLIADTEAAPLYSDVTQVLLRGSEGLPPMRSQLAVPILSQEELIGVINIESPNPGAFDTQSLDMLEQLAVQAVIAIKNAHIFKEQQEMQKRLASVDQVAAMGDIASNMVHKINNWVGSIRVDAKHLLEAYRHKKFDPEAQEELLEILADMLKNCEQTLTMAEKIRSPFQSSSQEAEPINVNECILNVLEEQTANLTEVTVIRRLAEHLFPVQGTQQIEQVFQNLIMNALQAMNNRGKLWIETRNSSTEEWVEVTIADSGPGLPEHIKEDLIFKLGVSSRPGGMGYGLWWCDTFLKRMGGSVELLASSPKGCKFLVRLPIKSPA